MNGLHLKNSLRSTAWEIDVDYDNPGPEISSSGQLTSSGYLSTFNEDELAAKRRKRKRMLTKASNYISEGDGDVARELAALITSSLVLSVSVVSDDEDEPPDKLPVCISGCWLKNLSAMSASPDSALSHRLPNALPNIQAAFKRYEELELGATRILSIKIYDAFLAPFRFLLSSLQLLDSPSLSQKHQPLHLGIPT